MKIIIIITLILIIIFEILEEKKEKQRKILPKLTRMEFTAEKIYIKKELMTNNEKYFYKIIKELKEILKIEIHPQTNLATIIKKEKNNKYVNELFRNIDFAIFSKDYEKLLLLIEIDDSSHKKKSRIERDKKVNKILKEANIKIIRFYTKYENKPEYVKKRIIEELKEGKK